MISVPVVQELAANDPNALPPRYIRSEDERLVSMAKDFHSIPTIDMELLSEHHESREKTMDSLASACKEWGFFQVVNHGIPGSVLDQMKIAATNFFQLPVEEKLRYSSRGHEGYGQIFVVSEEQTLDWSDRFFLTTLPKDARNMDFWPTSPVDFSESINEFGMEIKKLSDKLLSLIAETLGVKGNSFIYPEGKWVQGVRVNYYPRCPRPDLVFGIPPHSDASDITILLQDDEQVGLHIRKNEEWVPVQPIPGALVINIGDMLEVRSNGRYKSFEHVAIPNNKRDRMSIATFGFQSKDAEVGPHPDLIDDTHPALYTTFKRQDFDKIFLENKLEGKSALRCFKIQSSTQFYNCL
ncbi:hypothetical protein KI387_035485, partial [Taxus chinensis]